MLFLSRAVGKEKTMVPRQRHVCYLVPKETLKQSSRLVFNLVFLARLVLQQRNHFLTHEHVLLGDGQREQADVTDEGAPGLGSGERSFGWQRVVRLDHEVNGQQDQAQREQPLREKTGSELMRPR